MPEGSEQISDTERERLLKLSDDFELAKRALTDLSSALMRTYRVAAGYGIDANTGQIVKRV